MRLCGAHSMGPCLGATAITDFVGSRAIPFLYTLGSFVTVQAGPLVSLQILPEVASVLYSLNFGKTAIGNSKGVVCKLNWAKVSRVPCPRLACFLIIHTMWYPIRQLERQNAENGPDNSL